MVRGGPAATPIGGPPAAKVGRQVQAPRAALVLPGSRLAAERQDHVGRCARAGVPLLGMVVPLVTSIVLEAGGICARVHASTVKVRVHACAYNNGEEEHLQKDVGM
eukprot:1157911-Pelagomonas_calceolata.AAC.4